MENKKYATLSEVPYQTEKFVERGKIDTPNTYIHDHPISGLVTGTWIESGRVKLVLGAQSSSLSEMMRLQVFFTCE